MPRKRANGEGELYQRKTGAHVGLWEGSVVTPQGRKFVYSKTKAGCLSKLNDLKRKVEQGIQPPPERLTLAEFLTGYKTWPAVDPDTGQPLPPGGWLGDVVKPTTRPRVFQRYEQIVRCHILPDLGKLRLTKVFSQAVQRLYSKKLEEEKVSPGTVAHIHEVLRNALNVALDWGWIPRNPCKATKLPEYTGAERKPFNAAQATAFIAALEGERFAPVYVIAISTGMRQSELLGLKWADVDLEAGEIHVRRTIQRVVGQGFLEQPPKSRKSRRTIALTTLGAEVLKHHRICQLEARIAAGPLWEDRDLVFPNSVGKPVESQNLTQRYFKPLLKKAGLPPIHFHDLRHSAATLLIALGANVKVVQEILGHSTSAVTLDIYSHALQSSHREAIEKLGNLLASSPNTPPPAQLTY